MRGKSFSNSYSGFYTPQFPEKWLNPDKIQYLSLWERRTFKFLENHPNVSKIGYETIKIPYYDAIENKDRMYFMDLEVHFKSGKKYLIEIKPHKQTIPPEQRNKKGIRKNVQLSEMLLYKKNISKWKSAEKFSKDYGYIFEIWTEKKLFELGISV
jgi:hypothetical protein